MATVKSTQHTPPPVDLKLTVEDFRAIIGKAAAEKDTTIYKNGTPENANIVTANIFKYSTRVYLYAYNMDGTIGDVLEDYHTELLNFLTRDAYTTVEVVLDKFEEKKSRSLLFLLNFRKRFPGRVKISKASEEFLKGLQEYTVAGSKDLHFMTGDQDKFRLEYNKETKSAYFGFNNKFITETLINVFEGHRASCKEIAA